MGPRRGNVAEDGTEWAGLSEVTGSRKADRAGPRPGARRPQPINREKPGPLRQRACAPQGVKLKRAGDRHHRPHSPIGARARNNTGPTPAASSANSQNQRKNTQKPAAATHTNSKVRRREGRVGAAAREGREPNSRTWAARETHPRVNTSQICKRPKTWQTNPRRRARVQRDRPRNESP